MRAIGSVVVAVTALVAIVAVPPIHAFALVQANNARTLGTARSAGIDAHIAKVNRRWASSVPVTSRRTYLSRSMPRRRGRADMSMGACLGPAGEAFRFDMAIERNWFIVPGQAGRI